MLILKINQQLVPLTPQYGLFKSCLEETGAIGRLAMLLIEDNSVKIIFLGKGNHLTSNQFI